MGQSSSTLGFIVIASLIGVALIPNGQGSQAVQNTQGPVAESSQADSSLPSLEPRLAPNPAQPQIDTVTPVRPPMMSSGDDYVSLQRAPDSHFYVDAEVNGTTVHFLIDTGATSVVLAAADAQRVGFNGDNYTVNARTAGGEVRLMPVTAERLALGPFASANVPVLVAKDQLPISLLGQSYLSRIGSVTINGDTMTLR